MFSFTVSQEELRKLRSVFREIDYSGFGNVALEEVIEHTGEKPSPILDRLYVQLIGTVKRMFMFVCTLCTMCRCSACQRSFARFAISFLQLQSPIPYRYRKIYAGLVK